MPLSGGIFTFIIVLIVWLVPILFAVWLYMSINEIRSLLRSILTELRLK